ncbi:MAG: hypothetical protein SWK90_08775 [Chloroflexota bacterium]|nr:hypothetical protein [Chloroflexota bacterium]
MMKTQRSHWFILLSLLALTLTACGGPATSPPTAGPTETRAAETPLPTETVTATPAPTETPTPPPLDLADAQIVYLDMEDHLWLMNANSTAHRQLTHTGEAGSPTWSPDGQTLAYIYYDEYMQGQTMLYDMQRGTALPIGLELQFLTFLSWSPDGRYLILDVGTGIGRGLVLVELATGQVVQQLGAVGNYAWSPEGDALVIGQRRPLDKPISVEPGDTVSLAVSEIGSTEPKVLLEGSAEVLYFPRAWLLDGRILYDRMDWDEAAQSGSESLWTVTWENGQVGEPQPTDDLPLHYDCDTVQEHINETVNMPVTGFISWAPDGRHLVFQAGMYPDYGIYLLDWESDDPPRHLADGISPAWRPASPGPTRPAASRSTVGTRIPASLHHRRIFYDPI